MRTSSKVIKKIVSTEQNINVATERIIEINENKINNRIIVTYGFYDEQGAMIEQKSCIIQDSLYELIMSDSPDFAPGKPENEYRESDLWYIIDMLDEAE